MPGGDRTGPAGFGPMTGRGAGFCAGYPVAGYANAAVPGRGLGFGFGRGRGRGFGRGMGRSWAANAYMYGYPYQGGYAPADITPKQEADMLKNQAEAMKQEIEAINQRITELESK